MPIQSSELWVEASSSIVESCNGVVVRSLALGECFTVFENLQQKVYRIHSTIIYRVTQQVCLNLLEWMRVRAE